MQSRSSTNSVSLGIIVAGGDNEEWKISKILPKSAADMSNQVFVCVFVCLCVFICIDMHACVLPKSAADMSNQVIMCVYVCFLCVDMHACVLEFKI